MDLSYIIVGKEPTFKDIGDSVRLQYSNECMTSDMYELLYKNNCLFLYSFLEKFYFCMKAIDLRLIINNC